MSTQPFSNPTSASMSMPTFLKSPSTTKIILGTAVIIGAVALVYGLSAAPGTTRTQSVGRSNISPNTINRPRISPTIRRELISNYVPFPERYTVRTPSEKDAKVLNDLRNITRTNTLSSKVKRTRRQTPKMQTVYFGRDGEKPRH